MWKNDEFIDILENTDFGQKIILNWKCEACVKTYKNSREIMKFSIRSEKHDKLIKNLEKNGFELINFVFVRSWNI